MKKVYISYTEKNEPSAVILADNQREAAIALAYMKTDAYRIEEIDVQHNNNNAVPVIFLLTSVEANSQDYSHRSRGIDFRLWKRGN